MASARESRQSSGMAPTLPAPPESAPSAPAGGAPPPDSPEAVRAVLEAVRVAAPELTADGARLLMAQMSFEASQMPSPADAAAWVATFKRSHPMAWPAAIAGDAIRLAHLMAFARHPKAASATFLRELMAELHAALPS